MYTSFLNFHHNNYLQSRNSLNYFSSILKSGFNCDSVAVVAVFSSGSIAEANNMNVNPLLLTIDVCMRLT